MDPIRVADIPALHSLLRDYAAECGATFQATIMYAPGQNHNLILQQGDSTQTRVLLVNGGVWGACDAMEALFTKNGALSTAVKTMAEQALNHTRDRIVFEVREGVIASSHHIKKSDL